MATPPQTLPADFFSKQQGGNAPPATLPADFFSGGRGDIDYSKPPEQTNLQKLGTGALDALKGVGSSVVGTGVGAYNLARKIPGADKVLPPVNDEIQKATVPPDSTMGHVGKTAMDVGQFLIPGGAVEGGANLASKAGQFARLAPKAQTALEVGSRAGLEAGSAAGVTAAQTGGDVNQVKRAALTAGAVSAASPLLAGVVGKVAPAILGKTTGAGEEAIRTAATNPTPQFMKALRGDTSEPEIVASFKGALQNVKDARGNAYRQQLAALPQQQLPATVLDPVKQELTNKLSSFRIKINPANGELDFSRSVVPKGEEGTIKNIYEDVKNWDDLTPLGLDALKRRISNYYSPTSDVRAFTSTVENSTKKALAQSVPGYSDMTQGYANASDFIKKVEQELSLGPTAQQGTAIRKISYALKQNNEYRRMMTEALDTFTTSDLKGQLAGYHLKDTLPKGITGNGTGLGILGAIAFGHLTPTAGVALMASSPRLTGETLAAMSKLRSIPAVANATPKIAAAATVKQPPIRLGISGQGGAAVPIDRKQLEAAAIANGQDPELAHEAAIQQGYRVQ